MVQNTAPGGPAFPVASAEALAATLDGAASDLEEAARLRSEARDSVPEFQGVHADNYRDQVARYLLLIGSASEEFRRAAGQLRDAVEGHQDARQTWFNMGQPI